MNIKETIQELIRSIETSEPMENHIPFRGMEDPIEYLNSVDWAVFSHDQQDIISTIIEDEFNLLLLLGSAGTGKTFLIKLIKTLIQKVFKADVVLCAPTGVAANNISGTTISKAFKFYADYKLPHIAAKTPYLKGKYKRAALNIPKDNRKPRLGKVGDRYIPYNYADLFVIIDEISMVSSQSLFCIREYMVNTYPDRNVRFICVGDLKQLLPVQSDEVNLTYPLGIDPEWKVGSNSVVEAISPAKSHMWNYKLGTTYPQQWKVITKKLTTIHRQANKEFANELVRVGYGFPIPEDGIISSRLFSSLDEARAAAGEDVQHLFTTNARADELNEEWYNRLVATGAAHKAYGAQISIDGIEGNIVDVEYLKGNIVSITVKPKKGETVVIKNNGQLNWLKGQVQRPIIKLAVGMKYVHRHNNDKVGLANGYDGTIISLRDDSITVDFGSHGVHTIRYEDAKEPPMMGTEVLGTFKQIPGHGAHGMTIDLRQGSTIFDKTIIVLSKNMYRKHGLVYTGLTRITKQEDLFVVIEGSKNLVKDFNYLNLVNQMSIRALEAPVLLEIISSMVDKNTTKLMARALRVMDDNSYESHWVQANAVNGEVVKYLYYVNDTEYHVITVDGLSAVDHNGVAVVYNSIDELWWHADLSKMLKSHAVYKTAGEVEEKAVVVEVERPRLPKLNIANLISNQTLVAAPQFAVKVERESIDKAIPTAVIEEQVEAEYTIVEDLSNDEEFEGQGFDCDDNPYDDLDYDARYGSEPEVITEPEVISEPEVITEPEENIIVSDNEIKDFGVIVEPHTNSITFGYNVNQVDTYAYGVAPKELPIEDQYGLFGVVITIYAKAVGIVTVADVTNLDHDALVAAHEDMQYQLIQYLDESNIYVYNVTEAVVENNLDQYYEEIEVLFVEEEETEEETEEEYIDCTATTSEPAQELVINIGTEPGNDLNTTNVYKCVEMYTEEGDDYTWGLVTESSLKMIPIMKQFAEIKLMNQINKLHDKIAAWKLENPNGVVRILEDSNISFGFSTKYTHAKVSWELSFRNVLYDLLDLEVV
jgi:hypothetical protein